MYIKYVAQRMLEESAFHDQLTGLFNRNIIDTLVDENKNFQCFDENNISVLLFDIDFFKKVNDTYGHDGGDYNTSVRQADEALYEAKESGRNKVNIYRGGDLPLIF